MKPSPSHAVAPVIETKRLKLRAFEAPDLPDFCELWNESIVARYITGKALSVEDHWGRLLKMPGHWQFVGFGTWAITERTTGAIIGQCGFLDYRREMPVPMKEPEMGWALSGRYHGKGLAYEATSAALAWFDQHFNHPITACIIDPTNVPSQKLAAKLGYRQVASTEYKGKPTLLFHRLKT